MKWSREKMIRERMLRQGLMQPLEHEEDEAAYIALFKQLQPVSPVHFTRPGDPPRLVHRTKYDDMEMASRLRERHRLVKGRFQGGRIAYVLEEELKLYATAFRKEPAVYKQIHEDIMYAIRQSGGLSKEQLKEELGYPAKEIGKALQELHTAFLLYEQQTDGDWDTGWLEFANEWFPLPAGEDNRQEAIDQVIVRFIQSMVFATEVQIKSWSGLTGKAIKSALSRLTSSELLACIELPGAGKGWMLVQDLDEDSSGHIKRSGGSSEALPQGVYMMDRSDYLVRAYLDELQIKYKGLEVLQYLLIDGDFQGVVTGHWRIGPYNVEDVLLDLEPAEAKSRQTKLSRP
ncbi:DNA glycosylase AlkZ-like family protein [Paenibacillus lentus]|uniref:DNA glycosylase AlkZ-like family protein n=1 Tax=Paenibacillus lentus TaxID=1338368 RepID=UPI003652D87E